MEAYPYPALRYRKGLILSGLIKLKHFLAIMEAFTRHTDKFGVVNFEFTTGNRLELRPAALFLVKTRVY